MDFWYERVIREMFDINEEATELRRRAEAASRPWRAEEPDDEDEQDGRPHDEPDRPLG
jgi:hypothetical protein